MSHTYLFCEIYLYSDSLIMEIPNIILSDRMSNNSSIRSGPTSRRTGTRGRVKLCPYRQSPGCPASWPACVTVNIKMRLFAAQNLALLCSEKKGVPETKMDDLVS